MSQKIRADRPSPEEIKISKAKSDRRIAADKVLAQGIDPNSAVFRTFYSDI